MCQVDEDAFFGDPMCPCSPLNLFHLRDQFQQTYSPQERQAIAAQVASLVYQAIAGNFNPFTLLTEMGKLALLLSSSPTSIDTQFISEVQRALTAPRN